MSRAVPHAARMRHRVSRPITDLWLVVMTMLFVVVLPRQAASQGVDSVPSLRAGAARVDITPSPGELPKNSRGILDRLFAGFCIGK